jgi:hypothetical protein
VKTVEHSASFVLSAGMGPVPAQVPDEGVRALRGEEQLRPFDLDDVRDARDRVMQ